jgi:ArsR family metal-binding transcriptional regulator
MEALLHSITITNVLPCLADPRWIRIWADFSDDISGIMPYLNAVVPGIIYNPNGPSITIKRGERLITAYAGQIAIGKLADINDARQTLEWFKDLVNDTSAKKRQNYSCI